MNKQKREAGGGGFAIGVVTGAVMGAGLALLFAPKSGGELREDISESMASLRDAVARRYNDLADRAGVEIDDLNASIDEATEAVESTAREVIGSVSQHADRVASRVRT